MESIVKEDGTVVYNEEEAMLEFSKYFNNIFKSSYADACIFEVGDEFQAIETKITKEDNVRLNAVFTKEEVHRALFQMHPQKASGVDGFSAIFYQKYWDIVKDDVGTEVLGFLNQGELDQTLNMT